MSQELAPEDFEQQIDDQQVDEIGEDESKPATAPVWLLSLLIHALLLFVCSLVVFLTGREPDDVPAIKISYIDVPPPVTPPTPPPSVPIPSTMNLDIVADKVEKPSPISELNLDPTELSREEEGETPDPKGREEAVADNELGGTGAFMAIGAGGGGAGWAGRRNGSGKTRTIGHLGGSQAGQNAVDRALKWFKKHQSPNGQWSVSGYQNNCSDPGGKCEPGTEHTDEEGDVACSAYALLCFLGNGYDHRMPSRYKSTVKKAIDYLVSVQKMDGLWGNRNYEHAVATMALAEAYAMSNDPALRVPAQKGVDVILARQCKDKSGGYSLGWDYVEPKLERIDSSVSGWNVMALKSAAAGGLSVGNGLGGAKAWLEGAWKAANTGWEKIDNYAESTFPYTWNAENGMVDVGKPGSESHELACVGAVCAVFLGHKQGDKMLDTLCNYISKYQTPTAYPLNTYYLYYNTMAMFQAGGDNWKKWNTAFLPVLVNSQRQTGDCFDGSWDFQGTKFHGHQTGRLLSTAYNCLSLEVYYRYEQGMTVHTK